MPLPNQKENLDRTYCYLDNGACTGSKTGVSIVNSSNCVTINQKPGGGESCLAQAIEASRSEHQVSILESNGTGNHFGRRFFTESVSKSPSVYAQLWGRTPVMAVSYTLVPQSIIKTVALQAPTDKKSWV
jgi:hypothetical protein